MTAYRLPNGNFLVPKMVVQDNVIGDGFVEVPPDDPDAVAWSKWAEETGNELTLLDEDE